MVDTAKELRAAAAAGGLEGYVDILGIVKCCNVAKLIFITEK